MIWLSTLLALMGLGLSAQAHRLPVTTTAITWNEDTHALEIIHHLHVHDAEEGLAVLHNKPGLSLFDLEPQALLGVHVEENFYISQTSGVLDVQFIGLEVEGDYAIVYQAIEMAEAPRELVVHSTILTDVIPTQANHVNITINDVVQSVIFREDDDPKRLEIRETVAYQTLLDNEEIIADMELSDLVPRIYERQNDNVITHSLTNDDCASFIAPQDGFSRGVNSIFSFDLTSSDFTFEADHIIGNYPLVYSSADALILAEKSWDSWWFWNSADSDEATNIHMFDISNSDTTEYIASGRVCLLYTSDAADD